MDNAKPIEILLVEDNPADRDLTMEAFSESKILNNLNVAKDGEEALDYLHKKGKFKSVKTPDLILLDLNLPRKDGREVLDEIRQDSTLTHLPVIILTTSKSEEDVLKTYKLHVNCFITKPVEFHKFVEAVKSIGDFWFKIVTLPGRKDV